MEYRRSTGSLQRAAILRARATSLAEQLEAESFKCSRVLAQLDLKRARECAALAKRSLELASRFERWGDASEGVHSDRLKDVLEYDDLLEAARDLGVQEVA